MFWRMWLEKQQKRRRKKFSHREKPFNDLWVRMDSHRRRWVDLHIDDGISNFFSLPLTISFLYHIRSQPCKSTHFLKARTNIDTVHQRGYCLHGSTFSEFYHSPWLVTCFLQPTFTKIFCICILHKAHTNFTYLKFRLILVCTQWGYWGQEPLIVNKVIFKETFLNYDAGGHSFKPVFLCIMGCNLKVNLKCIKFHKFDKFWCWGSSLRWWNAS